MQIFGALKMGGATIYPLSILCIVALALVFDKILFYQKKGVFPANLRRLIATSNFSWSELQDQLQKVQPTNIYRNFFEIILKNRSQPIWWLESRGNDEAKIIEKKLDSALWILETIVTAAPLLGLLGTIFGMMSAFKLIGADALVNPGGITAGVAEALIATAFGLTIAIFALFAFNLFSRVQNHILDELELLGTRLIDKIKLENGLKKIEKLQ